MTTLEILKAGRELIADPECWTQRVFARDAAGNCTDPIGSSASCWCSMGALICAARRLGEDDTTAYTILRRAVADDCGLAAFNDSRKHADVLAAWDKAIAAVEAP